MHTNRPQEPIRLTETPRVPRGIDAFEGNPHERQARCPDARRDLMRGRATHETAGRTPVHGRAFSNALLARYTVASSS